MHHVFGYHLATVCMITKRTGVVPLNKALTVIIHRSDLICTLNDCLKRGGKLVFSIFRIMFWSHPELLKSFPYAVIRAQIPEIEYISTDIYLLVFTGHTALSLSVFQKALIINHLFNYSWETATRVQCKMMAIACVVSIVGASFMLLLDVFE